ncbi:MAG TPA: hypothetical protein VGN52_04505 [Burkholderiales bacterium]
MSKRLLTLFVSALALSASATAIAAPGTRQAPKNLQIQTQQKHATVKKVSQYQDQTTAAEESTHNIRGHRNGINNDAGVPPSGVPSETMNA